MAAQPGPDFRWGVVLRKSSLNAGGIEESTDRQEMELVHHIRQNNMGVIVQTYKDIASGWKPGAPRPRYKHALVDLASGTIDGIAVLCIDRLTRRRDQVRPILNALEEMGGRLFALWDELDTADDNRESDTELRLHELVARAEREARRTSQRYKLVAKHRARRGLHQPGSRRPFGHTVDWLNLVPHEAELLNEAALRVVAGESLSAICRDWTRRGIPTSTGKALWRHSTLRETLLSARLVGKREYDEALIDLHEVPAILSENLWRQACEILGPRYARTGRREGRPLSNIALCGICGLPLIGDNDRGTPIYVCRKRPAQPGACGGITVQSARVEARVDEEVVEFLNDKKRVEALLQQHGLSGVEMDAIDARYAELEDNKMALEEAAFNPPAGIKRLPRDRYWELRTQIEQEQERLQRRRAVNSEAEPLKVGLKETWTVECWQARPLAYRRAIVKLVTECVEVHKPAVLEHRGYLGARFDPDRVKVKFAA
jgi:DNA invertase Pin-like site-specific DNA recombinase